MTDWRLPENRREAFQRSYTFSLRHLNFPGMVYSMLPAVADAFDLDDDGRAWLAWLNGNTQNVVTSMLLLEAAPDPRQWKRAVDFWNEHFKTLEWDTDRRHQKSKFGEATEQWYADLVDVAETPSSAWFEAGSKGWEATWAYSLSQPHFGRLSAWSGMEFVRILLGADVVPDMGSFLLKDKSGSRSHRNGLAVVAGYDAWGWDADAPFVLGIVEDLEIYAEELLVEAEDRNQHDQTCYACEGLGCDHCRGIGEWLAPDPNVSRLTLESALCTYKSWHKPNRRYPNVYADMMYHRIKKAEARQGRTLDLLWDIRRGTLPEYLRLEAQPYDPGVVPAKQNHYRETGEIPMLCTLFEDMPMSEFDRKVATHAFGQRKDPKW